MKQIKFNNPWLIAIISMVIGVIITTIVTRIDQAEIKPRYSVEQPDPIAFANGEDNRLKIFWDETEVKNTYQSKVIIWNDGKLPIRSNDIKSFDPFTISFPNETKVLDVGILNRSRPNMKIEAFLANDFANKIFLKLEDEETIENKEGVEVKVLFSSSEETDSSQIIVTGGIAGAPKGWESVRYQYLSSSINPNELGFVRFLKILASIAILGTVFSWLSKKAFFSKEIIPWFGSKITIGKATDILSWGILVLLFLLLLGIILTSTFHDLWVRQKFVLQWLG